MATEATLTAEEKAAGMDALLTEEEQNQKKLEQDLKNMRDILFKKQEDMYKVRSQERDLEAVIEVKKKGLCLHDILFKKQAHLRGIRSLTGVSLSSSSRNS